MPEAMETSSSTATHSARLHAKAQLKNLLKDISGKITV